MIKLKTINLVIKKVFPGVHQWLKNNYQKTYFYRRNKEIKDRLNFEAKVNSNAEQSIILNDIFGSNLIVHNGCFKGLRYIDQSSGSALLPKLLGSYEEPIREWIKDVIEVKKYSKILNIGCAEGYYACGFAMTMPSTIIIAYDIDAEARKQCERMMRLNDLDNIQINEECTHLKLNNECQPGVLIFCDIEGFECELLDPIRAPNMAYVDLIVESHDCFVPGITDKLISRFYMTHSIRIVVDYPYRLNLYKTPFKPNDYQYNYIINEKRPNYMKYIYMESINGRI